MKKICSLFLIIVLLITGAGCTSSKNSNSTHTKITPRSIFSAQPIQTEQGALNGIPINNTMSLEQALTTAYPLSQLEEFFGTYSWLEWSYYDSEAALPQEKAWNQAHSLVAAVEHFPVQLLRYTELDGDPQAYSIYRIMEGGFYYIFWYEWYEDEEYPDIDTGEGLYVCRSSMYLNGLPSQADFESLIIGQSSLEDVCKLDSGTLIEFSPNFYRSYHILDNGLGISALYWRKNHNSAPRNRQDLILTDWSVTAPPYWILQSHLLTSDIPLDWRTSSPLHEITLSAKLTTAPETLQEKFPAQAYLPQHLTEQSTLIDNTTPLKQALTTSYSLAELDAFFRSFSRPEIPPSDQRGYFINLGTSPTLAQTNLKFPVEVLRCTNYLEYYTYYTVYQVQEGGYYYVFWNYSSTENPPFYYCSAIYLNGYFYREDFFQLTVGQNTLADVYEIDPTLTLQRYADQRYSSEHLLEDGNVLSLYYAPISETDANISAQNLVIMSLSYAAIGPNTFSFGWGILPDDLP